MSTPVSNRQAPQWYTLAVPVIAASGAIVPVFHHLIAKSALQRGLPIPYMSFSTKVREGFKAAPTVGVIVGLQLTVQSVVEKLLLGESSTKTLSSTLFSSAIVGTASAPVLAVLNGRTLGQPLGQTLKQFSLTQAMAITVQETAFVAGISVSDQLIAVMKRRFGNSKAIDYTAAFVAGAAGSLAGHPANTALTLWQSGKKVETGSQLMLGSIRKAWAIGIFSVIYKLGKEILIDHKPF